MHEIARYFSRMRRALYRRGQKREDIEDLMQDAFVRLLEYCQTGREVRDHEALLMTTVQRLAINSKRDRHPDRYVDDGLEQIPILDTRPSAEEVVAAAERMELMRGTLDTLGAQTRQVFFLQRLHGYSYVQISQMTGMPVSTIEKHIARAMTALLEERRREMESS